MMRRNLGLGAALGFSLLVTGCGIFGGDEETTPTIGNRVAVLPQESGIEADAGLADTPVTLPAGIANVDWTQPGGEAAKSLGTLALAESPQRVWTAQIGQGSETRAYIGGEPVVEGNRIFTMDTVGTVRAFDTQTGRELWSANLRKKDESERSAFGGAVSVFGGRVYATSGHGLAAAYDANTGAEVWRTDLSVPLRGAPTVSERNVLVVTQDNQVYALGKQDGSRSWDVVGTVEPAGLLGAAAPAVALDTAIVGFSSGELTAVRMENGRTVWQDIIARTGQTTSLSALSDIDASPIIDDDGRVYAMGHGGRLVALQLAGGQRIWEQNVGGIAQPWLAGDWIFAVSSDGELVAVSKSDGRIRWVSQLPQWRDPEDRKGRITYRGPVLAGGRLWLTSSEGQIIAASPQDGSVTFRAEAGKQFYLGPIVAGSTLYLLDESGRLSAWR